MKAKPLAALAVVGTVCLLIYVSTRPDALTRHPQDDRNSDDGSSDHPATTSGTGKRQAVPAASDDGATFATPQVQQRLDAAKQRMDPRNDGWETEVFSEAALKQLHLLEDLLARAGPLPSGDISKLIVADFSCGPLRPDALETVWQASGLAVRRQRGNALEADAATKADVATKAAPPATVFRGGRGCSAALQALREGWGKVSQPHVHFKLYRVEPRADQVATVVNYQAAGHTVAGAVQQNATWHCLWRQELAGAPPQLVSIEVDHYEEIVYRPPGSQHALFSDCTVAAIGKNPCFEQQLKPGLDHWARRIEMIYNIGLDSRYGLALGDVNGDELDDVFVCQPAGLPKRLFIHNPDGTVTDRSHEAGVDWLDHVTSALFVDLDNDGDQDLVLGTKGPLVLMENDGRGHFAMKALLPLTDTDVQSISAVDYDNDGYLDLFVCVDRKGPTPPHTGFVFHDARDGGAHTLFHNELRRAPQGAWKFTNVTAEVGLDKDNFRHSLAAAWEDYDDDGDQDLCIANDYGPKQLFRNDGGRFVEVTVEAGVQDFGSGMSVSWADYDRDGRMDLYLGNMFSSAGNRIAFQDKYLVQSDPNTRAIYQRFAKGNTLLRNMGGGKFQEIENAGVEMGRWAWSSPFIDVNNDGWDDVLVANGFITGDDSSDL